MKNPWDRWMKHDNALSNKTSYLIAFVSGSLLPLAFAPVNLFPLSFLLPAVLFYLWRNTSPSQAAIIGFFFGLGEFAVGVSWVYVAIHEFGLSSVPVAGLLTTLFVSFLALYIAVQGYISQSLVKRYANNHVISFVFIMVSRIDEIGDIYINEIILFINFFNKICIIS